MGLLYLLWGGYIIEVVTGRPIMNTAVVIAKHLKVNHWQVIRVEEWTKVFFAVVKGLGARFVSKKVAKMSNLPDLKGTEKQVAWANDIREAFVEWVEQNLDEETGVNEVKKGIQKVISAKWWIDEVSAGYEKKGFDAQYGVKVRPDLKGAKRITSVVVADSAADKLFELGSDA